MKVIIPVVEDQQTKDLKVDEFRSASKAYIYDCDTKATTLVPFEQLINNLGNLTLELKSKGIYTVISSRMSFLSLSLFLDSQLMVLKAKSSDLEENLQLYLGNQLEPFNQFAGYGAPGCSPAACSSCHDCN